MVEAKKPRGKRPAEGGYGRHREHRERDGVTTTEIRDTFKRREWLEEWSEETGVDLTKSTKDKLLAEIEGDD